jgi:hypothetical protein
MLERPTRRYTARLQVNDAVKTGDLKTDEIDHPPNNKASAKRTKNNNVVKKFTFTNKWAINKDVRPSIYPIQSF